MAKLNSYDSFHEAIDSVSKSINNYPFNSESIDEGKVTGARIFFEACYWSFNEFDRIKHHEVKFSESDIFHSSRMCVPYLKQIYDQGGRGIVTKRNIKFCLDVSKKVLDCKELTPEQIRAYSFLTQLFHDLHSKVIVEHYKERQTY